MKAVPVAYQSECARLCCGNTHCQNSSGLKEKRKKGLFLAQPNKSVASQLRDPGCHGASAIRNVAGGDSGGYLGNRPLAPKDFCQKRPGDFLRSSPHLTSREAQGREVQSYHTPRRKEIVLV